MSCYNLAPSETNISVPSYETIDGVEYFLIRVSCWNKKEWNVTHRFRDFAILHEKLQKEIALSKDLLPGKKMIKNSKFLEQRRQDLEKYLQKVMTFVQQVTPLELVEFLDFHKYDIVFLLQKMAVDLSLKQGSKSATFTILELHAISQRLLLPCPSFQLHNAAFDFSHILDFCSQIESVKVVPSTGDFLQNEDYIQDLINPIGSSNILASTLNFDLKPFSSIKSLSFIGIVPQNVTKCDPARSTVETFTVNYTHVQNIQQILLPELIHDGSVTKIDASSLEGNAWVKIKEVHFGNNKIWTIDNSMCLIPNVEEVHLNDNRLRTVANLSSLYHLNHLNLSGNIIDSLKDWHMQLGNIEILNLSSNKLKSLEGLSRLRSLRSVDLSWNQIEDFDEINEIAALPVIESVGLNGNNISREVDFRVKVLTRFGERCGEIFLDNERCSQNEIDKAMVLHALRMTKT